MNKKFLHIGGILLVFLFVQACKSRPSIKQSQKLLQAELDAYVKAQGIPGASFSIYFSEKKSLSLASGYAEKESQQVMKVHDRMLSGSIGKTYVAALIFKLIEAGKLSLDDPVKQYFKGEEWVNRVPNASDITIQMLLSHTTGIPRYVFKREVWKILVEQPNKIWTGKERLAFVFDDKPLHTAGKGWAYSDTNYIILGMIIEKITGGTYYQLLQEELLSPLGLKATRPSDTRTIEGLVTGYTASNLQQAFNLPPKMVNDGQYAFNPQMEWTGGGLVSNAYELAKWAKILYGGSFVSKNSTKLISTPGDQPAKLADQGQYGMGAIIWTKDTPLKIGHSGFMPGYISIMQYIPEYDLALAIQINTDESPKGESLHALLDRMLKLAVNI